MIWLQRLSNSDSVFGSSSPEVNTNESPPLGPLLKSLQLIWYLSAKRVSPGSIGGSGRRLQPKKKVRLSLGPVY